MKKNVCVILASYNGSKWIINQIESILNQQKINLDLFINDDCSQDGTYKILKKFSKKKKNIFVYKNKKNTGCAAQNFFQLIFKINFKKYDFISLSDQDDMWNKNKLNRAIMMMNKLNLDCYSSDVTVLLENGKTKYLKKSYKQEKFDFLFEGGGPGSTFVMKKKFINNLKKNMKKNMKITKKILFHDWYIYFYARINKYKWMIDDFSGLKYRQHGYNELGANINLKKKISRLKIILNNNILNQLKQFFLLNKVYKKKFKFLFCENKLSVIIFIFKNFMYFRRKKIEKIYCLFVIFILLLRKKRIV